MAARIRFCPKHSFKSCVFCRPTLKKMRSFHCSKEINCLYMLGEVGQYVVVFCEGNTGGLTFKVYKDKGHPLQILKNPGNVLRTGLPLHSYLRTKDGIGTLNLIRSGGVWILRESSRSMRIVDKKMPSISIFAIKRASSARPFRNSGFGEF